MQSKRIVLDTNCLLASISSRTENFKVWKGFQEGRFTLCVSTEIIEEYQEIIAQKSTPDVAENVIRAITESDYVEFCDPHFHLHLIQADPDDNKFVDCAFVANATFIVSNDKHFDVLSKVDFPKIDVKRLQEFLEILSDNK